MNIEALSLEAITAVLNSLPSPDEIKMLEAYEGERTELGNAEKYFLSIGSIPLLSQRVNSLVYKKTFDVKSKEAEDSLNILTSATTAVKTNNRFHQIMEIVLALGNYLNGNTTRGGYYGFKVQTLARMTEVRSVKKNNITLLHYLATLLERDHADLLRCQSEFGCVLEAARENMTETLSEINKLVVGLAQIRTMLSSAVCDAKYKAEMEPFLPKATQRLETLVKRGQNLQQILADILLFFGESSSTKAEDLFQVIADFVTQLEKCLTENRNQRALEAKKGKGGVSIGQSGEVDRIIGEMKTGRLFQQRVRPGQATTEASSADATNSPVTT